MTIIWAPYYRDPTKNSWYEDIKTNRPNRSKHGPRLKADKDERRWLGRLKRRYVRN